MGKAKVKCNEDCFNCIFDDCIVSGISSTERKEIRQRDSSYFNTGQIKLQARPRRGKFRGGHGFTI